MSRTDEYDKIAMRCLSDAFHSESEAKVWIVLISAVVYALLYIGARIGQAIDEHSYRSKR